MNGRPTSHRTQPLPFHPILLEVPFSIHSFLFPPFFLGGLSSNYPSSRCTPFLFSHLSHNYTRLNKSTETKHFVPLFFLPFVILSFVVIFILAFLHSLFPTWILIYWFLILFSFSSTARCQPQYHQFLPSPNHLLSANPSKHGERVTL